MPLRICFVLLFLLFIAEGHCQSVLLLENTKTGKKKEIEVNDRVKVYFSSAEQLEIPRGWFYAGDPLDYYLEGKVVAITDSVLKVKMAFTKDTFPIGINRIFSIQKYSAGARIAMLTAIGVGTAAAIISWEYTLTHLLLASFIAGSVGNIADLVVYPPRKVNRTDSNWKLSGAKHTVN